MKKKRYDTRGKKKKKVTREDDATYRITYLWGAAHLLVETSPSISRFYTSTIKKIGRRINLGLDADSMKRLICKKCSSLMLPGIGKPKSTRRIVSRRQSHIVNTCGHCGEVRRFLNVDMNQQTHSARPAIFETSVENEVRLDSQSQQGCTTS